MCSLGLQILVMMLLACTMASIYGAERPLPSCVDVGQACAKLTKDKNGTVTPESLCNCSGLGTGACSETWDEYIQATMTWPDEEDRSHQIQLSFCKYQGFDMCDNITLVSATVKANPPVYILSQFCKCERNFAEVYQVVVKSDRTDWYLTCQPKPDCSSFPEKECVTTYLAGIGGIIKVNCICSAGEKCSYPSRGEGKGNFVRYFCDPE